MPPPEHQALILRTCAADMTAHGGFAWPESGYVEAPDWDPTPECGHGLHGLLWGEGGGSYLSWEADARWVVAAVDTREVVDLDGKIKTPRAWVVHTGDRASATAYVRDHGGGGRAIVGGTATARKGIATVGDYGTAAAGNNCIAAAGNNGIATAGYRGTAMVGDGGTATAGDDGTATAGDGGTATAGDDGTATAGDGGTATAGNYGTATAGKGGTASAGYGGTVFVAWWDHDLGRRRWCVGEVGLDGIEANVPYKVQGGKLVRAEVAGGR